MTRFLQIVPKSTYILRFYRKSIIPHRTSYSQVCLLQKSYIADKMLRKLAVMIFLLGMASSEPIRTSASDSSDIISSVLSDNAELFELAMRPETITSIGQFLKKAIGIKLTALAIAVKVLHWLKSNFIGIAIGGIIGLGICKITGKCNLDYDNTISRLSSFVTPERLEMAQNLFISAIRSFGQEDEEDEEIEYE